MSAQRCLYPLFQNLCPHFLLSPLFWKLSQPSGQDQKNGKQTYCRLPQLTSRIQPLIFLWTPKGFIFPEPFLDFFLNLYILPWLQNLFIRIKYILNQKIKSVYFYSSPKQNSLQKGGLGGGRIMEVKKLNLQGYCSQALINSTIFTAFTFLVSVLLYHNLASSMLNCKGSLT